MSTEPPTDPGRIRRLTTPPGGIMTDEVGAISGPVEVWLEADRVRVRYEGALDTYTVTGAASTRTLDELASILTRDRGLDQDGNPTAATLDHP